MTATTGAPAGSTSRYGSVWLPVSCSDPAAGTTSLARSRSSFSSSITTTDPMSACTGRSPGLGRHAGEFSQQVRFGSARYSVPVRLIGESVGLRTDDGRLLVIMTGTGQVVAEHVLVAPGGASVRDEHYGGPRPAPRRAVRPKTAAEKAFCALGPTAEAFITGAAAAGHTRLGPELAELNTLRAAHGEEAFAAALDRAVAFGRWRAADVRSILAAGPGTANPRAAGDALVLELPVVPVRPLPDYAIGGLS